MFCDHLETVILGHVQDCEHRFVNYFTDGSSVIGWLALDEVNANERHKQVAFLRVMARVTVFLDPL
jgi:hypothetical protein